MKFIALVVIAFSFCASGAKNQLNCHTDSLAIGEDLFRSYDMSFPMNEKGDFAGGGDIFENTFPHHPVEPNPFLRVARHSLEIKDALFGASGEALLYFRAAEENFVLNAEETRDGKFVGTLKKHGVRKMELATRCYLFPLFP